MSKNNNVYTSNAYLVTGTWNALADRNTLVDVGADPMIMERLLSASTGVGKKRVEQVILTHLHYDHTGMLNAIREAYNPEVYAFSRSAPKAHVLRDAQKLRLGDEEFEVIHSPGHSHDSICLYCSDKSVLFSGDTCLDICNPGMTYNQEFMAVLDHLCRKNVKVIYPGHGSPRISNCNRIIRQSRDCVRKSRREGNGR